MLGGEVAGHRRPDGRRVRRVPAETAATPSTRRRPRPTCRIPDGVDERRGAGAADPGAHRLAPVSHLGEARRGRERGRASRGPAGSAVLAVQLAKPIGAGRVIATASTEEKRERPGARRRRGRRSGRGGPNRRPDRGQRGQPGGRGARDGGRARVRASRNALAPFGRLVAYGISTREQSTLETGRLMRKSRAVSASGCCTASGAGR